MNCYHKPISYLPNPILITKQTFESNRNLCIIVPIVNVDDNKTSDMLIKQNELIKTDREKAANGGTKISTLKTVTRAQYHKFVLNENTISINTSLGINLKLSVENAHFSKGWINYYVKP